MVHVSLSFFDMTRGPIPFLSLPELDQEIELNFAGFLDKIDKEGWQEYSQGDFHGSCCYFEIKSPSARGKYEMLLISIIFPKNEKSDFSKEPVEEFIKWFKEEAGLYSAFYDKSSKHHNNDLHEEAKQKIEKKMGGLLDNIHSSIKNEKKGTLLIIGLDKAGKTTLISTFKENLFNEKTKPTLGFQIIKMAIGNLDLQVFDAPGQRKFRSIWWKQPRVWDGIIYVVDMSDTERISESQEIFNEVLENCYPKSNEIPLLIVGNKIDKTNGENEKGGLKKKIKKLFNPNDNVEIFHHEIMSAKTQEGMQKGFRWLFGELIKL